MSFRKMFSLVIAAGAVASVMAVIPAGAHLGPLTCVIAAEPAQVNNVEMDPAKWTAGNMTKAAAGHSQQATGEGNRYGLYYPVLDPIQAHWTTTGAPGPLGIPGFKGDRYTWKQANATCRDTGAKYNAQGLGVGYCGRSIGMGTGTIGTHTTIISWESLGTQLVLTHPSATGSVNAQANPPGSPQGSCVSGSATVFTVDGPVVHQ